MSFTHRVMERLGLASYPHTVACPLNGCDWDTEADITGPIAQGRLERQLEYHYAQEHSGRFRLSLSLETESAIGVVPRDDIEQRLFDEFEVYFDGVDEFEAETQVVEDPLLPWDDYKEEAFGDG